MAPLESLNLGTTGAGGLVGKAVLAALEGLATRLNSLSLSYNKLDEEAMLGIVRAVRQHDKLTSLNLMQCNIGPTVARGVVDLPP